MSWNPALTGKAFSELNVHHSCLWNSSVSQCFTVMAEREAIVVIRTCILPVPGIIYFNGKAAFQLK